MSDPGTQFIGVCTLPYNTLPRQYQNDKMVFDASIPLPGCPFCGISHTYPIADPAKPNRECFDPELIAPTAFVVLSTPLIMAFLDIMPLSPGHLLVTTRKHHEKVSDISEEEAREMGYWLPVLSRVLAKATGVWDWNIVQNNGAAAAQVVPHVHFHIIPRPALTPELRNKSFTMFGRGQRSELDDEEAAVLAEKLRQELAHELGGLWKSKI